MNLPTPIKSGFPHGTSSKESDCQFRRHKKCGSIPESGKFPGEGKGNPLQYSCLETPMDRGAWWAIVHKVAKSRTCLKWQHAHSTYENWRSRTLVPLLPSAMVHAQSMECVAPWINVLSLHYGLHLSSFLYEAKNPHLTATPGTHLRPGTWPSSPTPISFLQQNLIRIQPGVWKSQRGFMRKRHGEARGKPLRKGDIRNHWWKAVLISSTHKRRVGQASLFMVEVREFLYLNLYHKERVELKWA